MKVAPPAAGNTRALKHGARSPRLVQPLADQLEAQLLDGAPSWWSQWDLRIVSSLAYAEAVVLRYQEFLDGLPLVRQPLPAEAELLRWDRHVKELRKELGLTPTSRLALARDAAVAGQINAALGATTAGLQAWRERKALAAVDSAS
jgi:hypothetical protein